MDWFLYDNGLRHDRVKKILNEIALSGECLKMLNGQIVLLEVGRKTLVLMFFYVCLCVPMMYVCILKTKRNCYSIYSYIFE